MKFKKFIITDDDGNEYDVKEEIINSDEDTIENNELETKTDNHLVFTDDEISALKTLAAVASKLKALVDDSNSDKDTIEDDDIVEDEQFNNKKDVKTNDSKSSVGSIEKQVVNKIKDSIEESEIDIANAWSKRYSRMYKGGE